MVPLVEFMKRWKKIIAEKKSTKIIKPLFVSILDAQQKMTKQRRRRIGTALYVM
jgi:hypothetical protein